MSAPNTRFVGPPGSTIHHLRADAATVAAVAGVDWNRRFRRVWPDAVRGVVPPMSPAPPHEELAGIVESVVEGAGKALAPAADGLRHTRLRRSEEPPRTGVEPDAAHYIGERADDCRAAPAEGMAAAVAFAERTGPDLVVEVEVTRADEGRIEQCAALGASEFWMVRGGLDGGEVEVEFLAIGAGVPPKPLAASAVPPGLTPQDAAEAVPGLWRSSSVLDRMRIVAEIARRRQEQGAPAPEERVGHPAGSAAPPASPCACSLHAQTASAFPRSEGERAAS